MSESVLTNWYATFKDLREAEVSLQEWLEYHRGKHAAKD